MRHILTRFRRGYVVFTHDLIMAAASFVLTLYLRLGADRLKWTSDWLLEGTILFTLVCGGVFWSMRLYRGVWRYASLPDLIAITKSATLAILIMTVLMFAWTRLEFMPRSAPFLNWFVLMALLGAPRFLYRLAKDRHFGTEIARDAHPRVPVLLAGAGDGAEMFIRALDASPEAAYRIEGILAEKPGRVGRRIRDVEVLGTLDDLADVVDRLRAGDIRPQRLVLTKDDMDGAEVRELLEKADALGMTLARAPRHTELRAGHADRLSIQPVDLEDLLGRPQTTLDREAMRALVKGKRVLVTGAGGSIGSELVRQAANLEPKTLLLLDSSEFALYTIDMEMANRHPGLDRHAVIADVRDEARIRSLFDELRPELVFHAAALKHVPLVEDNPFEGAMTNIVGTANVAEACLAFEADAMVQISTDKAINPSSVMGVTKRVAEAYCQALDLDGGGAKGTHFVTVRFGNVLGSTGSVVPLFQKQLAQGGPITITHPDMKRYFMTIREAVELVLEASVLGAKGREHEGRIFVLDMGEPVKIVDLARQMIRLAGLRPDDDVAIEFIGVRPGEKLFEEIFHGNEPVAPTQYPGIMQAAPRAADAAVMRERAAEIATVCARADEERLFEIIHELAPEYQRRKTAETSVS